jgi:hypothetical protein
LAKSIRLRTVSSVAPVSMCASGSPAARSSSRRSSTESPLTVAMAAFQPLSRKARAIASRAPCGLSPPALRMNFTPCFAASGHRSISNGSPSRAYPAEGSFCRSFCRMASVSSERWSEAMYWTPPRSIEARTGCQESP